jgi:uncharacterized protein (TIGR02246 family)
VDHDRSLSLADEQAIRDLFEQLLAAWNARDAQAMAATVVEQGTLIGFDGSEHTGRDTIATEMARIFADHPTARYVWKVRGVIALGADGALLRAVVGMVPVGKTELNPAVNAVQTLLATRGDGVWRVVQMQSTPAQYHGRPEMAAALTQELQELV